MLGIAVWGMFCWKGKGCLKNKKKWVLGVLLYKDVDHCWVHACVPGWWFGGRIRPKCRAHAGMCTGVSVLGFFCSLSTRRFSFSPLVLLNPTKKNN
jgi:hypothetical protein